VTITIPTWVLWTLGGIGALILLGLAALGVLFCWLFKDGFKIGW